MSDCPLTLAQTLDLGGNAYSAGLRSAAARCFRIAADQGNSRGEAALAYVYWSQDKANRGQAQEAFRLAQQSVQGNDGFGEVVLGRFYKDGFGTPADPQLGTYWMDKGHAQLKADEDQSRAQARAKAPEAIVQQIAIGALIAGFFGGDSGASDSPQSEDSHYWENENQARNSTWVNEGGGPGPAPAGWHSGDPPQ